MDASEVALQELREYTRTLGKSLESAEGTTIGETADDSDETIHIFSLASGHLYEKFLKMMMLSVSGAEMQSAYR